MSSVGLILITPNPSPSGGEMVSKSTHLIAAWVHGFVMRFFLEYRNDFEVY